MGKVNPIGQVDLELARLGFKRLDPTRRRRISMELSGKTKTGKTRFGLTMTEPIGILNTDRALDDILPEFPHTDLVVKDLSDMFPVGEALSDKEAKLIEAEYARGYNGLMEHKHVRSVMVDKWNTMWEVARFAEFGRASVKAHHYVPVNLRMRGYLLKFQQHDKNLLLIQDVKEEWLNDKPTGRWVVDGFKYTSGLVQVNLFMSRDENKVFHMEVQGCGLNADLVGWDFTDKMINFKQNLAPMVLADTDPKDWR